MDERLAAMTRARRAADRGGGGCIIIVIRSSLQGWPFVIFPMISRREIALVCQSHCSARPARVWAPSSVRGWVKAKSCEFRTSCKTAGQGCKDHLSSVRPRPSVRPSDRKLNAAFAIFSGSSSLIFLLLNKCNGGSDENLATLNDAAAAAAASAATQFASAHQMSISPHLSHLTHARAL